jgi:hypothetical protein
MARSDTTGTASARHGEAGGGLTGSADVDGDPLGRLDSGRVGAEPA